MKINWNLLPSLFINDFIDILLIIQVSNYLPGNPVTREFEATAHIASAGNGNLYYNTYICFNLLLCPKMNWWYIVFLN